MMGIPALTQPKVLIKPSANGYDSKYPDGGGGQEPEPGGDAVSGGSMETIAWTAPNGLSDGKTITVSSSAHTFVQPEKYIYLGFGDGWLYEQESGAPLSEFIADTANGAVPLLYEDDAGSARRIVYDFQGKKWLRTLTKDPSNGNLDAGGMMSLDAGRSLTPGDCCYMFSTGKLTFIRPEDEGKKFQLKCERIGAGEFSTDDPNSAYVKFDASGGSPSITAYEGSGSNARTYYTSSNGIQNDGLITNTAWSWKMNTPDVQDGHMYLASAKGGVFRRGEPTNSSAPNQPRGIIKSASTSVPRHLKLQDYVGNNDQGAVGIEILRTDLFWQINGSVFILADNANLSQATNFTPLVPISIGDSWEFRLWRGQLSDYEGAHIHLLDDTLAPIVGVSL